MSGRASNACQSAFFTLYFLNTAWANVGNAAGLQPSGAAGSLYVALHTADPTASGTQHTNEAGYTNYSRVAVARSAAGWTLTGSSPTTAENAAAIGFPQCGITGETENYFSVGLQSSGSTEYDFSGPLTSPLTVSNGITPSFAINACQVTID